MLGYLSYSCFGVKQFLLVRSTANRIAGATKRTPGPYKDAISQGAGNHGIFSVILTNRLTLAKVRCEQPALLGLRFCCPWATNSEPPFSSPASTYRSACCSCSTLEVRSLSTSQDASQTRSHALRRSSTDRTTCSNDYRHKRRLLGITLVPYTCCPPLWLGRQRLFDKQSEKVCKKRPGTLNEDLLGSACRLR